MQSPKFNVLVAECGHGNVLRDKEVRKRFNQVHSLRTRGLHRLERTIPEAQLSQIALEMYFFIEYLEDYRHAQEEKTVKLLGKRYRRIRYGKEPIPKDAPDDFTALWQDVITRPCHDCFVIRGEIHLDGCDMERCPRCSGQFMCCDCRIAQDDK
jgi:hypothetical protein